MELLEGRISVEAALRARHRKIKLLILRAGLHPETTQPLIALAEQQNIPYKLTPAEEIDAMAHGKTHGGVVALCSPKPALPIEELFKVVAAGPRQSFLLLLEGVDDSQNLGFVLRSAEACGITAVLIKKHVWDFDAAAVSRASSGAFERLPLYVFDQANKVLPRLSYLGITIYGCIANAQKTMYEADFSHSTLLALGGEKRGLSAAVREHCDRLVKIPMMADIGSLSLSHAAAIILAECMRQRLTIPPADI